MTYEGISFSDAWLKEHTLEQFIAEVEATQVWWPGDANRIAKATTVYFLANPSQQNEGSPVRLPSINTDSMKIKTSIKDFFEDYNKWVTEEHGTDTDTTEAEPQQPERRRGGKHRVQRNESDAGGLEHETTA